MNLLLALLAWLLAAVSALLVAVTLLPLSGSHAWWVRMWDFPRIQLAIAQGLAAALAFLLPSPWSWALAGVLLLCVADHLWRIRPFTPFARREMRFAPPSDDGAQVTLLSANVLMENRRFHLLARLIDEVDPDVLLLMETDAAWVDALGPTLARYPTLLTDPRPDHYGLVFATRLQVTEARIEHLTADDTPSVFADLLTASGEPFHFVGLHPQPPVPGVATAERDAQLLYAARFARRTDVALLTMGDFNDAAWSPTARLFKHYGRYLDPRVGRGLYASFHAESPLVRCAIDQLYVTEEVAVVDFRLGTRIGSDHLPIIARVRIDREAARRLNRPPAPMTPEEREEIEARVEEYRAGLRRPATTTPIAQ
jgi:endonuclease/exonuclease/phosphatase (EEP) superfamily protein YafD